MERIQAKRNPVLTLESGLIFDLTRYNFIGHIIIEIESDIDGCVCICDSGDRLAFRRFFGAFIGKTDGSRGILPANIIKATVNNRWMFGFECCKFLFYSLWI